MNRLLGFGPYRLDTVGRVLTLDAQLVPLPTKAIEVLLVLVRRNGEVVSKDDLMKEVWPDAFVEEGNLTQHIHLLRRALQDNAEEHRYILTVSGRGYSFVAPVKEIREEGKPELDRTSQEKQAKEETEAPPPFKDFLRRHGRKITLALVLASGVAVVIAEMIAPAARHFNNAGVELQGKGDIQSAIDEYRRALLLRPTYAEARYNLADAYEEIPDYDKAATEYQKAIDSDVTLYAAYNNLARLYILRRKDYGAALKLLDRGLTSGPKETSVKYSFRKNYGWANLELGNYLRAEQDLRLAVDLEPNRGAAHCLLAKLLDAQGKTAEAHSEWETCLGFSAQPEVEPEWRNEAAEHTSKKAQEQ